MTIKSVCGFSPAFNAAKTLRRFIIDGDESITSINRIHSLLASQDIDLEFLIIDDASADNTAEILDSLKSEVKWLAVEHNPENIGVTSNLLKAYEHLSGEPSRYNANEVMIVRLDSDLEHNPAQIPILIKKIDSEADGAISQIAYQREHQCDRDFWFDGSQAVFQSEVIFSNSERFIHNCPGYTAYTKKAVIATLPVYRKYLELYKKEYSIKPNWGGDMSFAFCAQYNGFHIDTSVTTPSTRSPPNRTIDKVLSQIVRNTLHLQLMRKIQKGELKLSD